jgi:hypothetical protein
MTITELKNVFTKDFSDAWSYLYETLKPLELEILMVLCFKAGLHNREIRELNGYTIQNEISKQLTLSEQKSKTVFKALFEIGAFGKFKVAHANNPNYYVWIINPFLSKGIQSDIGELFSDTVIANQSTKRYLVRVLQKK